LSPAAVLRIALLLVALALVLAPLLAPLPASVARAEEAADQTIEKTGQALDQTEDALVAGRRAKAKLDAQVTEAKQEILRVRREQVDAAAEAQDIEARVSALESHLEALEMQRSDKLHALSRRRDELTRTLAALQRISRTPPDLLIFMPASIQEISRARLVLGAVASQLDARADLLGDQLRDLARIGEEISAQRNLIDVEADRLGAQRAHLGVLLARKTRAHDRTEAQYGRAEALVADLAAEAGTLQELLDRLVNQNERNQLRERQAAAAAAAASMVAARETIVAAEPAQPPENGPGITLSLADMPAHSGEKRGASRPPSAISPPVEDAPAEDAPARGEIHGDDDVGGEDDDDIGQLAALAPVHRPVSAARGAFAMPARGKLVSGFDETTALGLSTKGIIIETRASAQIVAPYDGRVAFAGQFREYGLLLIIDHGEGYHTLLAGMGRIDVLLDQQVLAGEPVGVMEAVKDGKPRLYVELRSEGRPINPLPWLAAETVKVSG
jgi:septal ring factor EnvC (AmiA/AmiB activator)